MGRHFTKTQIMENKAALMAEFARLQREQPNVYECRKGKNEETLPLSDIPLHVLNEETRLLIVGTVIPSSLSFFWTGKQSRWILQFLDAKKKDGPSLCSLADKGDIEGLKKELMRLHVAFLDITDWIINKRGSSADRDVHKFTLDQRAFERVKELKRNNSDLRIVAASENAKYCLQHFYGIDAQWVSLFRMNTEHAKEKWIPEWEKLIREIL